MNHAIILSGGTGTRFWPLSNSLEPKQFLDICSRKPMLVETIDRISGLVPKRNIYLAANRTHGKKISNCIRGMAIPKKNVFLEPEARNTLAPIAYLSNRINKHDPDAVVIVLPCDHIIRQGKKFIKILKQAVSVAKNGYIVTMGIVPKRAETGYGYIKAGKMIRLRGLAGIYKAAKFIEKPAVEKALRLIKDRKYYWNSGIFVFKPSVFLQETKRCAPDFYKLIDRMRDSSTLRSLWPRLAAVSIDNGVMEHSGKIALLPAHYGWVDIGSWQALEEIMPRDKKGNITRGKCLDIDSNNSIIWSQGRLVATLGLRDTIVIETADAVLVCAKNKSQDVKRLVGALKRKGNIRN